MNMNKNFIKALVATLVVAFAGGIGAPMVASAQTSKDKARQKDKNLMRNLGVGAGAAAIYEGVNGRTTNAVVLGAGAALAGKKYEDSRKAQTRESGTRKVYRYRNGKKVGYYKHVNNKRVGYYRI